MVPISLFTFRKRTLDVELHYRHDFGVKNCLFYFDLCRYSIFCVAISRDENSKIFKVDNLNLNHILVYLTRIRALLGYEHWHPIKKAYHPLGSVRGLLGSFGGDEASIMEIMFDRFSPSTHLVLRRHLHRKFIFLSGGGGSVDSEMHNFNRDVFLFDRTVGYDNAIIIEAVDYVRNIMLINLKVSNIDVNRIAVFALLILLNLAWCRIVYCTLGITDVSIIC